MPSRMLTSRGCGATGAHTSTKVWAREKAYLTRARKRVTHSAGYFSRARSLTGTITTDGMPCLMAMEGGGIFQLEGAIGRFGPSRPRPTLRLSSNMKTYITISSPHPKPPRKPHTLAPSSAIRQHSLRSTSKTYTRTSYRGYDIGSPEHYPVSGLPLLHSFLRSNQA